MNAYKANSSGQTAALFFIPILAQVGGRHHIIKESGLPQISNAIIAIIERLSTGLPSLTFALLGLWWIFGASQATNMLATVSFAEIIATITLSTIFYVFAASSKQEKILIKLIFDFKTLKSSLPILALTLSSYALIISCFSLAITLKKQPYP